MKSKIAVLTLAVLMLLSISAVAEQTTTEFKVKGMVCDSCRAKTEKALKGTEGVTAAVVDWKKGTARVEYDDAKVSKEQLKKVITDSGFAVEEK